MQLDAEITDIPIFRSNMPYIQHNLVGHCSIVIRSVIVSLELSSYHQRAHICYRYLIPLQISDHYSVSQAGDSIAYGFQLLQIVGDKNNTFIFAAHFCNQTINQLAAFLRQRRSRFVDDEDFRL